MNKKLFILILLAILLTGGGVAEFFYQSLSKRPAHTETLVNKGNIQNTIELSGKIVPENSANLGFEKNGKIIKIDHQIGDFVKMGDFLASTNADDLQAQLDQAEALTKSSEDILDQYKELLKVQKAKLGSLKKTKTANSSDKKAQRAQISASDAQIDAQEEQVTASLSNIENIKSQLKKTIIEAPFDGIIARQDIKVGEIAGAGTPIITLVSQNSFKIESFTSLLEISRLKIGDLAQITLDNNPEKILNAKITSLDPIETDINNVSNYKITLIFVDSVSDLRSGISANIKFRF